MLGWFYRRLPRCSVPLVLYTRKACPLCDEMKAEIGRARVSHRYSLTEVDVDLDPELVRRYGERVPVLWIAGRRALEGRWNAVDFGKKFERLAGEFQRAQELARALDARGI